MKHSSHFLLSIIGFLIAYPLPVCTQEKTVEGAHKVLELILSDGAGVRTPAYSKAWNIHFRRAVDRAPYDFYQATVEGRVEGEDCATTFIVNYSRINHEVRQYISSEREQITIQWSDVVSTHVMDAETGGRFFRINTRENKSFDFIPPSLNVLTRALTATEFLRASCDPLAETGF